MKWKIIIAVVVVVLVAVAGVAAFGVWLVVRDVTGDIRQKAGVDKALAAHEAELRAVPGLTMLGTYTSSAEPPYIVVTVREITPQVRAAVPATLDGYRVVLKKDVPPTSPPLLAGEVRRVKAATTKRPPWAWRARWSSTVTSTPRATGSRTPNRVPSPCGYRLAWTSGARWARARTSWSSPRSAPATRSE